MKKSKQVVLAACLSTLLVSWAAFGADAPAAPTGDTPNAPVTEAPNVPVSEATAAPAKASAKDLILKGDAKCTGCHDEADEPVGRQTMLELNPGVLAIATTRHGVKGDARTPTCTDCHYEHKIEALKNTSSLNISEQVCSKCHASERMNTKYNLPRDRVKTFFDSYHGLAMKGGSLEVANCASCHGSHGILPSSDPRSAVNKANLAETCGRCHPGANARFVQYDPHPNPSDYSRSAVLWWANRFYWVLIPACFGFFGLHSLLWFWRSRKDARSQQEPAR